MLTYFLDSDSDYTRKSAAEHGAKLISMPYSIDDVTVYPYESVEDIDLDAFYEQLRGGVLPTTFALNEEYYIKAFEPEFAAGNDIFYIHFSEAMSMTFGVMRKTVAKLQEKYPERKFYEVDTRGMSGLSYVVAEDAFRLLDAGKTPEEVIAFVEQERSHWAVYFYADNLKFFRRSGRVSGLAATMGGLIGLRPIIFMNDEGKMISIGTEKGRMKAIDRLVGTVAEIGDLEGHDIVIVHAGAPETAEDIKSILNEKFPGINVSIQWINPTVGAHCGPDTVGICFHAIHR